MPAFAELDFADVTGETWNIIVLPASAPVRIVDRLHGAIVQAAGDTRLRDRLEAMEAAPVTCTPDDLALRRRAESGRWKDILQRVGFVGDRE